MKLSRELKTAIIVLGGILLFILGYSYLKSNSLFDSSRTYYAVYDNVNGLTTGTAVTINGLKVGRIKDISFLDNQGNLLVTFSVESDFEFSRGSEAEIYDTGIIGGKSLRIIPDGGQAELAKSGDTLKASIEPGITELVTQRLTPLQEKLESVMIDTDSVLTSVDKVLDAETRQNIRSSVKNLNQVIYNFRNTSADLAQLVSDNKSSLTTSIENVNNITTNLSKVSDTLANAELGSMMAKLKSTADKLDNIIVAIDQGEGSLGQLIKDEELYNNLSGASDELNMLLEDIRLNPKRYVHFSLFGKKAKPYEEPEEEENQDQ
ncbi:MlaD family protein [Robertkochia aurantiaca]|uniref:MlaD family protein n=1 Tax=Robertkochia aurantiaca TaxID=2873700 RepID=UPI001CC9CDBB|nr:MlaD family protein [Robertkochia sp. 3YJGBD-33]